MLDGKTLGRIKASHPQDSLNLRCLRQDGGIISMYNLLVQL